MENKVRLKFFSSRSVIFMKDKKLIFFFKLGNLNDCLFSKEVKGWIPGNIIDFVNSRYKEEWKIMNKLNDSTF